MKLNKRTNIYLLTINQIIKNMKKKLLKSMKVLLVAAGLGVGENVWAATGDVTTNVSIDFSNEIVSASSSPKYSIAGTVGSNTWD